ncbi:hypothetical protein D9615_006498 [Tricholomella constricta]|uniref:LisH domain-containing protein n=1 Tax=Tricholomella constricta TaxID=117010 RepID=A0A8H5H9G9_9AGAR|nr:hypothetical protein D9615_006498 [Tricholomella constricta]
MATVSQPGPAQQQPPSQTDNSPPALSWEGEKMFNIYIYDYCFKRGFRKTARELMVEAEIAPDPTPPINARQGLLFEWWSVFWVLFTAKANGNGTEEAMLYTQHQTNQLMQRQATQRLAPGQSLHHGQQPQPGMPHQPPPPMTRLANGGARPGMMGFMSNGPMPNGVGPPQGPMQPGGPNSFSMAGGAPQPNGIPGQPGPSPSQGGPSAPGQNFQPLLPGQRPSISGGMPQQHPPQQPSQQRGPNAPFQSPNMANSPQNPPPGQQPPQHPQQQHAQPPMGQLGGPSPHLSHLSRSGMLPPNQGMNPMNPQQGQQGNAPPPASQYQHLGRSPSRATTPGQGQGGMMHPSPSITNRQPPGAAQMMVGGMTDNNINSQIMLIPTAVLAQIKQELGIEKELPSFTAQDKQRILGTYRARHQQQQNKPGGGPPDNPAAGPSNPMMQLPNQQQRNNLQQRNQPPQQQQQQQRAKRNSTSPGEEHENLPRNESSPPDRKRIRRSPMEQPAVPVMNFPQQQPQPHPQQQGAPQMMNIGPQGGMMVMRGQPNMGMNGGPGQHPGQQQMPRGMGMGMGMGGQQQMHMGGGMTAQMGHPGGLTPHMQNQQMQVQAREQLIRHQQMVAKGQQPGGLGNAPGNAASPPSTEPSFIGAPLGQGPGGGPGFGPGPNRMGQKSMMPPPSPAMNGPPEDQNSSGPGGPNNVKNANQNPGMPANHSSPRNPPSGGSNSGQTPNANGTGPPTPAPGGPQNQNPGGSNQPGGGGLGVGGQNMAPSPSSILGGPPSMGGPPSLGGDMSGAIFSSDFIQSVASSLDEFNPDMSMFRPDGDINFERDFGQWFNPDDVPGLDMK